MRIKGLRSMLLSAAVLVVGLGLCQRGMAQDLANPEAPKEVALLQPGAPLVPAAPEPAPFVAVQPKIQERPKPHRFWDRDNSALFAATAVFSAADFVVTRDNLRNGGQELNPITRVLSGSTPGLAMNFAGETAGVVGLSYWFHRTGHHRLERAVSILNLGGSVSAVGFGLMHR
jgi:hypothetical protein